MLEIHDFCFIALHCFYYKQSSSSNLSYTMHSIQHIILFQFIIIQFRLFFTALIDFHIHFRNVFFKKKTKHLNVLLMCERSVSIF